MPTPRKAAPEVDTTDPSNASPEARELVGKGAAPAQVDVERLLKQIRDLQNRITQVEGARGTPSDPVEAGLKNLYDHVVVRKNMHLMLSPDAFSELVKALILAQEQGTDGLTEADVAYLRECVDDLPSTVEGKEYLQQLAHDLRTVVRERDQRDQETEV